MAHPTPHEQQGTLAQQRPHGLSHTALSRPRAAHGPNPTLRRSSCLRHSSTSSADSFALYQLLRAIPWAARLYTRGVTHVMDWFHLSLRQAAERLGE